MKILIVDDNRLTREMLRRVVGHLCEQILECGDGCEALDFYRTHLPDWVLMDWEMKRMDGIAAARGIVARFPTARILIVTIYDDDELRRAATAAGACGFVLKDNLFELRRYLRAH